MEAVIAYSEALCQVFSGGEWSKSQNLMFIGPCIIVMVEE